MSQYISPPEILDYLRRIDARVQALANTRPVQTGAGVPSSSPQDGAIYVDTTNSKLYVRTGGAWKSVTLT